jgi:hypothetical protein
MEDAPVGIGTGGEHETALLVAGLAPASVGGEDGVVVSNSRIALPKMYLGHAKAALLAEGLR